MTKPKVKPIHVLMLACQAMLLAAATPFARIFMEAVTVESLEDRLIELNLQMETLSAKAESEGGRLFTEDEQRIYSQYESEFETVDQQIEQKKRSQARAQRLAQGTGRTTAATGVNDDEDNAGAAGAAQNNGGAAGAQGARQTRAGASSTQRRELGRTRPMVEDDRKGGFRHMGEFAQTVKRSLAQGNAVDPRLVILNATFSGTTGNEGSGGDGGFAVPPDFRTAIMEKVAAEQSLIARTDQLVSSSNTITIPKDETTPWQSSGGIQAYWEGEAEQHTKSKPALESSSIKLNKLTAMVNVTDELLEDAPALGAYIKRKAPVKIDFKITDAIIRGTGAGMPMGVLNAACKVKIAKENAQTAATIVFANIVKMYAQLYSGCRGSAVWLINQDIEPQLFGLQFPGSGTAVPVYLPPGGLAATPYGLLMGRPVLPFESCSVLGTEGDIILTDLQSYMTAQKVSGLRSETSMHLYFDYDITAFKFILRVAGQPWWNKAIDPGQGSNKRSCILTLADRG